MSTWWAFKCALEGRSRSLIALWQFALALKPRDMPYNNGMRGHLIIELEFDFLGKFSLRNAGIFCTNFDGLCFDNTLPRAGGLRPPPCPTRLSRSRRASTRRRPSDSKRAHVLFSFCVSPSISQHARIVQSFKKLHSYFPTPRMIRAL